MANAYGAQGPVVMGITWTEAALAITLVLLRAKAAALSTKDRAVPGIFGLRWDFIWVIIATMLALTAQSLMTVSVVHGLGNHQSALSPSDIVKTNFWSWMAQIVAILCLVVARFAVMAFLLAIQKHSQERAHHVGQIVIYCVGSLQAVVNVAEVILILQQCDPVQKLWDQTIPGTCNLVKICSQVGYFQGSVGVLDDLLLAGYAAFFFCGLRLEPRIKAVLCLVTSGGLIAAIAGICKTIAISSITQTTDLTYATHTLNTWVLTEMWFIIIFGSIPPLRHFFMTVARNIPTSPGYAERNSRKPHTQAENHGQKMWVRLDERSSEACVTTCEPSAGTTDTTSNVGTDQLRSGQIKVTMTAQVHNGIC